MSPWGGRNNEGGKTLRRPVKRGRRGEKKAFFKEEKKTGKWGRERTMRRSGEEGRSGE